jgi:hypothetical protein
MSRTKDRRDSLIVGLLIACVAVAVIAVAIVVTRESEEEKLAGSLAAQGSGRLWAGCTEQEAGDWFYCGRTSDPSSGWSRVYAVRVDDEDCWVGVSPRYRGQGVQAAGRLSGCIGEGGSGDTIDGPGRANNKLRDAVPRLFDKSS